MIRQKQVQILLCACLTFGLFLLFPAGLYPVGTAAWPGDPVIDQLGGQAGSDPLLIHGLDNGNMGVFDWDEAAPGSGLMQYVNRYFDDYCWSTVLFFTDSRRQVFYGDAFQDCLFDAAVSVPLQTGDQQVSPDQTTLTTGWTHPDLPGLSLVRQLDYEAGTTVVSITLTVTLTAGEALSDLTLLHGGDLCFFDEGRWEQDSGRLIARNLDLFNPRRVIFIPDDDTPWDHWYAGNPTTAWEQVAAGSLSDTLESDVDDAACLVAWHKATLSAGESWSVTTREDYSRDVTPTPTVEPTPTVTPTPAVSPTPVVSPTLTVSPTPALTPGLTPTLTVVPTARPSPIATPDAPSPTGASPAATSAGTTAPLTGPTAAPNGDLPQTGENRAAAPLITATILLAVCLIWIRLRLAGRMTR